jgi:two-component system, chemotaxis family, chemotaxis protein CheY
MARVLLVDHNQAVLRNVRHVLINEGLDICGEATNGRQAIEEAARLKPDCIVLDHSLPDITGVQTAYEIRQRIGNVKIVFFTLCDEVTISAAARVVGADAFVSKSSPGELVLALRRLTEDRGPVGLGGATVAPAANPQAESRPIQNPFPTKSPLSISRSAEK